MHTPDRFSVDRAAEPGEDYTDDDPYAYTPWPDADPDPPDAGPRAELTAILHDYGWEVYGAEFIPVPDFTDYARELAEDCGMLDDSARWPCYHIDWEAVARDLAHGYTLVTIDGSDYYAQGL